MKTDLKTLRLAFGYTIRQLRKERGISQTELAQRSEIDRSYLSALESGARNVALNNIFHLASSFGLLPSELLAIAESNIDAVNSALN